MKASRRLAGILLMLAIGLAVSGCWDRRELQDRNFVMAVAIDTADAGQKPQQGREAAKTETFVQPYGEKRYRVSLQVLRLVKAKGDEQNSGDGKTYVISNTGQSIFEIVRDMLGQSSKSLYFEHIQTIIISEAALKDLGLRHIIDWFLRDAEMRWRIKVYVTPGEARPILEYVPPSKEAGGIYLANIVRNHQKNIHVAGARTDLGNISVLLDNKMDIAIPRIDMVGNVVKMGGAAVLKRDKFVGYLDEQAVAGIKMMRATEKSAIITLPGDEVGEIMAFELFRHDTRLTPHVDGNTIYFTLDINMWGNVGEYQKINQISRMDDPGFIHSMEQRAAQEVKRSILYGYNMCQSMGIDLVLSRKLKAYYPKIWEKVKDDWDEIYPTIPLEVSVNVVIDQIGGHK